MDAHFRTPRVLLFDPRGLTTCAVDYWRADASLPAESRVNRTTYDTAGRATRQWDPRLWLLQKPTRKRRPI